MQRWNVSLAHNAFPYEFIRAQSSSGHAALASLASDVLSFFSTLDHRAVSLDELAVLLTNLRPEEYGAAAVAGADADLWQDALTLVRARAVQHLLHSTAAVLMQATDRTALSCEFWATCLQSPFDLFVRTLPVRAVRHAKLFVAQAGGWARAPWALRPIWPYSLTLHDATMHARNALLAGRNADALLARYLGLCVGASHGLFAAQSAGQMRARLNVGIHVVCLVRAALADVPRPELHAQLLAEAERVAALFHLGGAAPEMVGPESDFGQLAKLCRYGAQAQLEAHADEIVRPYAQPGYFSRNWHLWLGGGLALALCARFVAQRRAIIQSAVGEACAAIQTFWDRRVVGSVRSIYHTIRYDDATLSIAGSSSLTSELDSLNRMIESFAQRKGVERDTIPALLRAAERGDISVVMRQYEIDIRSPIRSAIGGDLVESLLIQAQREKVDLERAKLALDRIMRANELNFQFLAAIPAILIAGFLASQLKWMLLHREGQPVSVAALHRRIQSSVREMELMLHRCRESPTVGVYEYGHIMLHMDRLVRLARHLHPATLRRRFADDIGLIADSGAAVDASLAVVARIGRQYAFLNPSEWRE